MGWSEGGGSLREIGLELGRVENGVVRKFGRVRLN